MPLCSDQLSVNSKQLSGISRPFQSATRRLLTCRQQLQVLCFVLTKPILQQTHKIIGKPSTLSYEQRDTNVCTVITDY